MTCESRYIPIQAGVTFIVHGSGKPRDCDDQTYICI